MGVYKDVLLKNNYLCHNEEKGRLDFNKGYTSDGFADKVFHLHLRYIGDNDELYLRDYLNEHDRDGYTKAKGEFIQKYTILAKKENPHKYANLKGEQ